MRKSSAVEMRPVEVATPKGASIHLHSAPNLEVNVDAVCIPMLHLRLVLLAIAASCFWLGVLALSSQTARKGDTRLDHSRRMHFVRQESNTSTSSLSESTVSTETSSTSSETSTIISTEITTDTASTTLTLSEDVSTSDAFSPSQEPMNDPVETEMPPQPVPLPSRSSFSQITTTSVYSPRTTWNATTSSDEGARDRAAQKLKEIIPFIVILLLMIAIGLLTGIRCVLRARRRRKQQYLANRQSQAQFRYPPMGIEKPPEMGRTERNSTSRQMWSILASKKGFKKMSRPLGRRRAVSDNSVFQQSRGRQSIEVVDRVAFVDVGFGYMVADEPEQYIEQGSKFEELGEQNTSRLVSSKSSPDLRKKPVRRTSAGTSIHTPTRPSPLRQSIPHRD